MWRLGLSQSDRPTIVSPTPWSVVEMTKSVQLPHTAVESTACLGLYIFLELHSGQASVESKAVPKGEGQDRHNC